MYLEFKDYTLKSLVRRRKTLRLPVFLCCITIAIMFFISILYSTIQNSLYEENKATYGSWNLAVYNTTRNTCNGLWKNVLVDKIGTMTIYGEITNLYGRKNNYIGSVDDVTLGLTSMHFEQGRYPLNSSEIALEKEFLLELGIPDTLGSKVTLYLKDTDNQYRKLTFTLCGIITPYHNNYLQQGSLVNAFVTTNCSDLFKAPLTINNFLSLKEGYATEAISKELFDAFFPAAKNEKEQWFYNTYIEASKRLTITIIFIMMATGAILLTTTYLSFYKYYVHRFTTLLASQVVNLDKKKIMHIFRQESLLLLPIYSLTGCLTGILISFFVYHISRYFCKSIYLNINWNFLIIAVLLTITMLLLAILTSRFHSYYIITREPVLHLPSRPYEFSTKKYKRFPFILKRFLYVYKKSLCYHVILHIIGISSLLCITINWTYTYDCLNHLENNDHADYSIKQVKEIASLTNRLSQIQRLSEVEQVNNYSYTNIGSFILVRVDNASIAPFDHYCYVNTQPGVPKESVGIYDDTIELRSGSECYSLKIQNYSQLYNPNAQNPMLPNVNPFIFCNANQYNEILSSLHLTNYQYIKIGYAENCNPHVVTSIIDRILFDVDDIALVHNYLVLEQMRQQLLTNGAILTLICLFTFLTSFIILRNQQQASLQYMYKELKIFWCLGLSKYSIRKYTLILHMLCTVLSLPFCLLITYFFSNFQLHAYHNLRLHQTVDFLLRSDVVAVILTLLLLYFMIYLYCLIHDIKQTLKNLYNLT